MIVNLFVQTMIVYNQAIGPIFFVTSDDGAAQLEYVCSIKSSGSKFSTFFSWLLFSESSCSVCTSEWHIILC